MARQQNRVTLDGVDYVVLPLNWEALEECQDDIVFIQAGNGNFFQKETRDAMLRVITAGLKRASPDVTLDTVRKGLDISNVTEVLEKVMSTSGFTDVPDDVPLEGDASEGKAKGGSSQT